jgi:hypothetical protein
MVLCFRENLQNLHHCGTSNGLCWAFCHRYHRPNLVSRAVGAFYLREPEDLSAAAKARRFGPVATSSGRTDSEPFTGAAKSLAPVKVHHEMHTSISYPAKVYSCAFVRERASPHPHLFVVR